MDKKLQMLERLYESDGEPRYDGQSTEDATGAEAIEMRLMSEAKFVLDHKPGLRPDVSSIDAIVQRAALAAGTDQRPAKIARIIPLRWQAAVAAVFVLFAVGIVYWQVVQAPVPLDGSGSVAERSAVIADGETRDGDARARRDGQALASSPPQSPSADDALLADEDVAAFAAPPASVGSMAEMEPSMGVTLASTANDSIPSWDDSADLRLVQKRIDMLRRSGGDLDWGTPAVPLEELPQSRAAPGIRAAGASGNNN